MAENQDLTEALSSPRPWGLKAPPDFVTPHHSVFQLQLAAAEIDATFRQIDFVHGMMDQIKSGDPKEAAMRFIEEISSNGFRSDELKTNVEKLNERLTNASLPTVDLVMSDSGVIDAAYLNDGLFYDTLLYKRPAMLNDPQWRNAEAEYMSSHLEAFEELVKNSPRSFDRSDYKRAAEFLVNHSLEMVEGAAPLVLQRASKESYKEGHSLNVVLADLDGDGERDELSDVALNYSEYDHPKTINERIDLYDPPLQPAKPAQPAPNSRPVRLFGDRK